MSDRLQGITGDWTQSDANDLVAEYARRAGDAHAGLVGGVVYRSCHPAS